MEGLHFPLLISGPKEVPITAEQHEKLSVFGIGAFMITYPVCFADKGDHVIMYCREDKGNEYHSNPRFAEVIPGRIVPSVEMAYFTIPKTTKLFITIDKYFKHLFLK
jgi:hypothetical protein